MVNRPLQCVAVVDEGVTPHHCLHHHPNELLLLLDFVHEYAFGWLKAVYTLPMQDGGAVHKHCPTASLKKLTNGRLLIVCDQHSHVLTTEHTIA
jgi:hypothetical protein